MEGGHGVFLWGFFVVFCWFVLFCFVVAMLVLKLSGCSHSGGTSPELASPARAQRPRTLFGSICSDGRKFAEREHVMLMLSLFPEILISDLMALPPLLLSSKNFFKKRSKILF